MRLLIPFLLLAAVHAEATIVPENLKCEYRRNPLGIDQPKPRLSWTLSSKERSQRQTAYRILVASSLADLQRNEADLWDSGKVDSPETAQIEYRGRALISHQRCFWKVMVWDGGGRAGPWSSAAEWSMGVLLAEDWRAEWIARRSPAHSPMPRFRKRFVIHKPFRRAISYASAGGFFELYLNGERVGNEVLAPLWSNYRKSVYYVTHDVTRQLREGVNVSAAELGNGFYNVPGWRYAKFIGSFGTPLLIVMMRVEHEDGSITTVGTDGTWKTAPGPITFSCIFGGEDHDARLEQKGWLEPDYDDSKWQSAGFDGAPGGTLVAQNAAPIKVMRSFQASLVGQPAPGVRIYDAGQNIAGWPRVRVRGPAGSRVRMATAELLDEQGRLDTRSTVGFGYEGPRIFFQYTLKGEGIEEWHPRFTYTGFRFIEVTGDAEVVSLEADFVHSSAERAGVFTSSNYLFNRINELVDNAVRSNLQGVLTDCPHREKLGWLEVAHLMWPSILFYFDAANFLAKIARDASESQLDDGLIPSIAPEYCVFRGGFRDSPEWGSAIAQIPWLLYRWYGDRRELGIHYEAIARYDAYLKSRSQDGILTHGLGDWLDIGPGTPGPSQLTPQGLTATAFRYSNLRILETAAAFLGKPQDARRHAAEAAELARLFHAKFFDRSKGYYATGSQTAQALPLVFGLVPPQHRSSVVSQLERDIRARDNQQTAGDIGFRFVVRALTDSGRSDVLYDMTARTSIPSYGAQIARGLTSLAESWDATPTHSQNHCMLGHIQEWFMSGLAGIDQAEDSAGFSRIRIRPSIVGDLESVSASYDSIKGRIGSRWWFDGKDLRMEVTIPVNSTAEIFVPGRDAGMISEGSLSAPQAPGLRLLRQENGSVVFEAGSGTYFFTSPGYRALSSQVRE